MDKNKLDDAIARASALINDAHFNALVESKAPNAKKKSSKSEFASFEAQAFGSSSSSQKQIVAEQYKPIQQSNSSYSESKKESKIPSAILESFQKMPAMSGGNDSMMVPPSSYYEQPKKQVVMEQYNPQPTQINIPQQGIDYNYIKYIVNECIKENMSNMLNESASTIKGLKIGGGNKIQFLDSKGNLYEGVLTLKKKAQQ